MKKVSIFLKVASVSKVLCLSMGQMVFSASCTESATEHEALALTEGTSGVFDEIRNATNESWDFIPVPGTQCRDGSETGFVLNKTAEQKKLVIYLDEGGACFNGATCLLTRPNTNDYLDADQGLVSFEDPARINGGLMSRDAQENPEFWDWDFAFVPECTGDVFAGDAEDAMPPSITITNLPSTPAWFFLGINPFDGLQIPDELIGLPGFEGGGPQQFVGNRNMRRFLRVLRKAYPNLEELVVAGSSAGAFGVIANKRKIDRIFDGVSITVVSDSAPPLDETVVSACLQDHWRELWNLENTVLRNNVDAYPSGTPFLQGVSLEAVEGGDSKTLFASSRNDDVMRTFHAFGKDNNCSVLTEIDYDSACAALEPYYNVEIASGFTLASICEAAVPVNPDPRIDPNVYENAWNNFESVLSSLGDRAGSFEIAGSTHVHLEAPDPTSANDGLGSVSVDDGERLDTWISNAVADFDD